MLGAGGGWPAAAVRIGPSVEPVGAPAPCQTAVAPAAFAREGDTRLTVEPGRARFAVDPFATTPLYLARGAQGWAASHSLRDLGALAPLRLDPARLRRLARDKRADGPGDPLFAGVAVAEAGGAATVEAGRLTIAPPPDARPDAPPLPEAEIEAALSASLARRIDGLGPVCFALSGGVDSTLLAALGARLLGRGVVCYAADSGAGEDLAHARMAAADLGAEIREVPVPSDADALALHRAAVAASRAPIPFSGNAIGFAAVCRAARADGFRAIVDGAGGDPIFGGGYMLHGRWWAQAEGLDRDGPQFRAFLAAVDAAPWIAEADRRLLRREPGARIDYGLRMWREISRGGMARWRSHHVANARAHDIAVVSPFLDRDVVRYLWNPSSAFFQDGWNKAPLRRLIARDIRAEVAWRKSEQGLRWPVAAFYARNAGAMRRAIRASAAFRAAAPALWLAVSSGLVAKGALGRLYAAALAAESA